MIESKHICHACSKTFPTKNSLHGHKGQCKEHRKYIDNILTESFLRFNLITMGYTCSHIANVILGKLVPITSVFTYAKKYKLPTKNQSEAARSDQTRGKYVKSCNDIYGVNNTFQSPNTLKILQERYGEDVTNIFQVEQCKLKARETCLKKYGTPYYIQSESYAGKRNNGERSYMHMEIEKILDELKITYESEYRGDKFLKYNKIKDSLYAPRPDIILWDKRIVLEVYGDRWHGNPKDFVPTDTIKLWGGEKTVADIWKFDEERIKQIESFGFKCFIFWGSDIKRNREGVKERIQQIVKECEQNENNQNNENNPTA